MVERLFRVQEVASSSLVIPTILNINEEVLKMDIREFNCRNMELDREEAKLKEQLAAIEEKRSKLRNEKLKDEMEKSVELVDFLIEHRDFILSHLKHTCGSCVEGGTVNGYSMSRGYANCTKCFLTEILNNEYSVSEFKVDLDFTITHWEDV